MSFESSHSFEAVAASLVRVGNQLTRVWPEGQPIAEIADPRIRGTRFRDRDAVNPLAARLVLHGAAALAPNHPGFGGKKVRDLATWNSTELQLLTLRALCLVCAVRGVSSAHVVDRWANVMQHGEYSGPHCHYESEMAVVYALDSGDAQPQSSDSGQLEIIDSRIPFCCPSRPERPTRGILPDMAPGTLIAFPAEFLHSVTPYRGQRPRITLAWNVSPGPPPDGLPDPTQPCHGAFGAR